ncbi:MAG: hypothetical protein HQK75_09525 [Candidatus Magnetomorum sp.]|nr:hypothetical protein [Candidatus Magnetomorum sp.]
MEKATTLKELIALKNRTQITPETIDPFYVSTIAISKPPINEKIKQFFEAIYHVPQKMILAGPKGSGKSTLLCLLSQGGLERFHIIPIHLLRTLDPMDISQVDIIFCLLNHLVQDVSQTQKRLDPSVLNGIYQCLHDEQLIHLIKFKKSEAGDEEGTKIGFVKTFISAIVEALSTTGSNIRTQIREILEPGLRLILKGIQDIIDYINRIYQATNQILLIIFDDLDQFDLSTAELFFQNHLSLTERLNVHIIYTMPDFIRFSYFFQTLSARMGQVSFMRMTPVLYQNNTPCEQGQIHIKEIICKRIARELIQDTMLDLVILASGGVLHHAFDLLIDTALNTLTLDPDSQCLHQKAFDLVYQRFTQKMIQQMDSTHVELLAQLNLSYPSWAGNKHVQHLMARNILIEYECNGSVWFDIHPSVKRLIVPL